MGRPNHLAIDNFDVEVHPSNFSVEYVPDPDTTQIKTIDGDKIYHLL